ncbi:MAG TPA: bifunctional DedA family/phosphatase PAP2 family protein [Paenibacillus cookii]|nr:bifunctional DedA family/phosphatase PAP2 family protein [Paenibacillus cookii]
MVSMTSWLEHYGYALIFTALFLEMLALPLPGEMMMSYTGLLVFEGKLNWLISIVAAGLGVSAGVALSYWIGYRFGNTLVTRYGERIHLGEERLAKMTNWFGKYGNKLLFVAYFIPGVRHITGYFCGITRMPFRKYAGYALPGAVFWVSLFISLGRVLGPKWEMYHKTVNRYMVIFGILSAVLGALIYVYRKNKPRLLESIGTLLKKGMRHFNSLGKVRFLVLVAFAVFMTCVSLMLGLIQDFLAQEFSQFDEIASYIILALFGPEWRQPMGFFAALGSDVLYASVILVTALWVLFKSRKKLLELSFFLWVLVGGELLDDGLRALFHRPGPVVSGHQWINTFPSEDTLTAVTIYGYSAFLMFRHAGKSAAAIPVTLIVILACVLIGTSRVYFGTQFPSDVVAGYVFGGVWISLNVILLEILRMLQKNKKEGGKTDGPRA